MADDIKVICDREDIVAFADFVRRRTNIAHKLTIKEIIAEAENVSGEVIQEDLEAEISELETLTSRLDKILDYKTGATGSCRVCIDLPGGVEIYCYGDGVQYYGTWDEHEVNGFEPFDPPSKKGTSTRHNNLTDRAIEVYLDIGAPIVFYSVNKKISSLVASANITSVEVEPTIDHPTDTTSRQAFMCRCFGDGTIKITAED